MLTVLLIVSVLNLLVSCFAIGCTIVSTDNIESIVSALARRQTCYDDTARMAEPQSIEESLPPEPYKYTGTAPNPRKAQQTPPRDYTERP